MNKKAVGIFGLILAIGFLAIASQVKVPSRSLYVGYLGKYVGGDAYNYIMEANLISGEIAAARISQAVYYSTSGILFLLSLGLLVSWQITPKDASLPLTSSEDELQEPLQN